MDKDAAIGLIATLAETFLENEGIAVDDENYVTACKICAGVFMFAAADTELTFAVAEALHGGEPPKLVTRLVSLVKSILMEEGGL